MKSIVRIGLAKRVRQLREKHNYTQDKLAELTGIDYKYVQRIEGKTPPAVRIDTLVRIADAFGITLSKLLDFDSIQILKNLHRSIR